MKEPLTILSTRKLSPPILEAAAKKGLRVIDADFIEVKYEEDRDFRAVFSSLREHIVFTSRHAVMAFLKIRETQGIKARLQKVFCLRGETQRAIQNLEETGIVSIASNAKLLAEEIIAHKGVRSVTFICGDRRRNELPDILAAANVKVEEVIVYRTRNLGGRVNQSYDGVFFFSPSAVESFFQTNILPRKTTCFCIGSTTATAVAEQTANTIITATEATQESLLNAATHYFFRKKKFKSA